MNYVQGIEDLFNYLSKQIEILIKYLKIDEFQNMLIYLYNCIPEPIQAVFIFFILMFCLRGFVKAFHG